MIQPEFPDEFNLADYCLFDRLAEGLGDKVALRFGAHGLTYQEIADRALATSTALRRVGLPRGGRVLLILRDIPAFAWAFFGALRAGGVVVMGNPDLDAENHAYLVKYTQASIVLCPPRVARALAPLIDGNRAMPGNPGGSGTLLHTFLVHEPDVDGPPHERCLGGEVADVVDASDLETAIQSIDPKKSPSIVRTHRDEPAIWLFTSGSTGKPKAAMHAHGDFAFNTEVFAKSTVGLAREDVTVSVPRLFFGYATGTNLMFPFAVGATTCLFPERPTPETLIAAIERYAPTVLTLVPTLMGKLLEHDEAKRKVGETGLQLDKVRFSYSAGEALPGPLLSRWTERFRSDVYDGIGSAEMFHIYCTNRPGDIVPGSLGKVVEGYELRILSEDASSAGNAEVPRGDIGVLWVRGPSVAFGYYLDRRKSFETFHGAWCRTGDLFHMDAAGYLYFDGRSDDLLKVSGQFVAPLEVEECLLGHPAVAEVVVLGCVDQGLLKPKAIIVLRAEHQVKAKSESGRLALRMELQSHVKDRLSKHKYPRFIVFSLDLPKNDRGKLDRKLLREMESRGELPELP